MTVRRGIERATVRIMPAVVANGVGQAALSNRSRSDRAPAQTLTVAPEYTHQPVGRVWA